MARQGRQLDVEPLKGLAPWAGGKRNLARLLAEMIARVRHTTYAEPFIGMGGVFFRRARRAKVEVLNDLNGDVVTLFRVVKHHPEELLREMQLQVFAREEFNRFLRTDPAALTDIQRAARFYWLQRMRFSGMPTSRSFSVTPTSSKAIRPEVLRRHVLRAHARLACVTIENLPYQDFIQRYDRPHVLFYLDPPYWGCEDIYGRELFSRGDFERLAGLLGRLTGRFFLSINDRPEVRELFGRFRLTEVTTTYSFKGSQHKPVTELVVTNTRPPR